MLHFSSNHITIKKMTQCSATTSHRPQPSIHFTTSSPSNAKSFAKFGNNTTTTTQGIAIEEGRKRWMECQGVKNWEGLIDPLDDTLRAQILSHARFIEAAYRCFDFDMSSPTYATCHNDIDSTLGQCGLGDHRYRVTKNLYATCTTSVPRWIERILNVTSSPESSWIGYVAVCDDAEEIHRLGHRRVVIAFRGTATAREWLENLRVMLTPVSSGIAAAATLPADCSGGRSQPMVQQGLLSLYTSSGDDHQSLQDTIREEIRKIVEEYGGEGEPALSVTITGHSLGGALATLTAYDLTTQFGGPHASVPLVTAVSFGGPRVGNGDFRRELEASDAKVLRIVNRDDPITKVPGFVFDDVAGLGVPAWLQKYAKYAAYAEVGKELRLSSKDRGLPRGKIVARSAAHFATCHDLNTYLHLIQTFTGYETNIAKDRRTIDKRIISAAPNKELMDLLHAFLYLFLYMYFGVFNELVSNNVYI